MLVWVTKRSIFSISVALLALYLAGASTLLAAQFRPINAEVVIAAELPDYSRPVPYISAISGDGSTIGGTFTETCCIIDCASFDCYNSAFVWSIEKAQLLDLKGVESTWIDGLWDPTHIVGLSGDGTVALAWSSIYATSIQDGSVAKPLELLLGAGVSGDGRVFVGSGLGGSSLWTESAGVQRISDIPADSLLRPVAVSGDGRTVALVDRGYGLRKTIQQPYGTISTAENVAIWSEAKGLQHLEPILGHDRSLLTNLNLDGSVVVGASSFRNSRAESKILTATLWEDGIQRPLGSVGDFDSTIVTDVSADGVIAVGVARYERKLGEPANISFLTELRKRDEAVLWIKEEAFLLREFLANTYGLADALEGWRLTSATAISDDGATIAGQGIDPAGTDMAWVVTLGVPEPGSSLLLVAGLLLQASTCRRWHR